MSVPIDSTGAGAIVDDELLAGARRELLPVEATEDVRRAARGECDHHAHRFRRIRLRGRNAGERKQTQQ